MKFHEGEGGSEGRMALLLVGSVEGRRGVEKKATKLEVAAPRRSFAATAADGKLGYAGAGGNAGKAVCSSNEPNVACAEKTL